MKLLRRKLGHALPSLLLSAGLLVPVLGLLDPSFADPVHLLSAALVVLVFELATLNRRIALISLGFGAAAVLFWLFGAGGRLQAQDLMIALSLRLSGQQAALPLIADTAVRVMAVLIPLLACLSMTEKATWLPALCLTVIVTLLAWLSNRMDLLLWLLPAFSAVLLRLILDRYEGLDPLRLLPWVLLPVALAWLLVPRNAADLAPLREKADDLRQAVMDRLFFTEARDVFSLSAEGYYPQGPHQLGGKPELSDRPVMQVSAPRTVYLRGVVYNEYNGRAWVNTTGGRRYLWQALSQRENRAAIFNEALPPETARGSVCDPLTVSVRMLSDSASTLFVPQRIRLLEPGGDLVPYFSNASEVFVTRNLEAGATWSVEAPLFVGGDPGLARIVDASAAFNDVGYERILNTYTQLPAHLEQPVYTLAAEASAAGLTPYEKALAIQNWLARSFRYTLEVEDQPENQDFVTRFLLETREGYCTYFASAMTVLCRMVGLPARYVEGYLAEPDTDGRALVTGRSGHAWTEVYFSGFGWLTFDATPHHSASDSRTPPPASAPTPTPTPAPSESPSPEPSEEPTESPSEVPSEDPFDNPPPEDTPTPEPPEDQPPASPTPPPTPDTPDSPAAPAVHPGPSPLWWILGLLALLVSALALRLRLTDPKVRARRPASESARFEIWVQDLAESLRAEGLTREAGETPMAFARRVDRTPRFSVPLLPCGECLSLIRYAAVQPLASDTELIRATASTIRRELSAPARVRCLLRRIFLPNSRRSPLH